jgi:phosphatidate cytidylyltransferase
MLKERIGTALVLFILFLAALFYLSDFQWALLMLAVISMGAWEWASLIRLKLLATRVFIAITIALGAFLLWKYVNPGMFTLPQQLSIWLIALLTVFWAIMVPFWLAMRHHLKNQVLMMAIGLLVLLPTWLALDGLRRASPLLLLAVMMTIWIADTAAYFFGKKFGRRKLAPAISPGKTWEGVAGAMLGVTVYGVVLSIAFNLSYWLVAGLLALAVLSIVGDLFESLLKRQAGLKDSSSLLPGHGGVLDRIDGLTSSLPLAFLYFPFYHVMLTPA